MLATIANFIDNRIGNENHLGLLHRIGDSHDTDNLVRLSSRQGEGQQNTMRGSIGCRDMGDEQRLLGNEIDKLGGKKNGNNQRR